MKTKIALLLGLTAGVPLALADLPASLEYHSAKADVTFQHPDSYKDIKDAYMPTDRGEKGLLDVFGKYITGAADDLLPEGYHLTMVFTGVDFAGDFEPWRGPLADDIRIIKDIYPPAYKFSWKLTNASGQVVGKGNENLSDMDFQMKGSLADDMSPLRDDKNEINDWLRTHLRHLK